MVRLVAPSPTPLLIILQLSSIKPDTLQSRGQKRRHVHGQALAQLSRAPEVSQRKLWVWPPSSHLTSMVVMRVRLEYGRKTVGGFRQFPGLCGNEIDRTKIDCVFGSGPMDCMSAFQGMCWTRVRLESL